MALRDGAIHRASHVGVDVCVVPHVDGVGPTRGKGTTNNGDENNREGVSPRALKVHHAIASEGVVNENSANRRDLKQHDHTQLHELRHDLEHPRVRGLFNGLGRIHSASPTA